MCKLGAAALIGHEGARTLNYSDKRQAPLNGTPRQEEQDAIMVLTSAFSVCSFCAAPLAQPALSVPPPGPPTPLIRIMTIKDALSLDYFVVDSSALELP